VRVAPTPEAVFALRGALDASPLERQLASVGAQIPTWGPAVSYSPDGRRLAVGSQSGVTIFAIPSGRVLRRIRLRAAAAIVAFSPDGSLLAVATANPVGANRVVILDASTGAIRRIGQGLAAPKYYLLSNFAFSDDGSVLYFAAGPGVVRWNLRTDQKRLLRPNPSGHLGESGLDVVALSRDGRRVAVGGFPGLALLDTATGRVLATAYLHRTVWWVAFSPHGSQLAVASGPELPGAYDDGTIALLDPRTLATRRVLRRIDANTFTTVAFSPDGTKLAYGGGDGSAGVIELPSGAQSIALPGHVTYVYQVAFSPNGRQLATAAGDGTTLLWRIGGNAQQMIRAGRFDPAIDGNDVPADLRLLADRVLVRLAPLNGPGRGQEQVLAWSLQGRALAAPLSIRRALPNGLGRLSDDGRVAVTIPIRHVPAPYVGAAGAPLQVWDLAARRITHSIVIDSPIQDQLAPAVSPDDSHVALGVFVGSAYTQPMELVNLATGAVRRLKPALSSQCAWTTSGYSPNGRYLAASTSCGQLDIWNTTTGRKVGHQVKFSYTINLLAPRFSPDGSQLAIANTGNSGQVSILDVATDKVVTVVSAHTGQVEDIAYSPNGKLLATASIDHTVRIWDAHTGRPLRILYHPDPVDAVAFGPTGNRIATLDYAGTIRIWDACTDCENPTALLALARQRVTRQLTPTERRTFLGN
jgi:WD40 repeat protein